MDKLKQKEEVVASNKKANSRPVGKEKRITITVSSDIDVIRNKIQEDTGVVMTYVQTFDYLIHFYMQKANEPKTRWAILRKKND